MRTPYIIITTILLIMISTCLAQYSPEDFLEAHNQARRDVGVGPIVWNKTIEDYAQNYANSNIQNCDKLHSNGPYGENLAWAYGELTAAGAVQLWLAEKPNYDPITKTCRNDDCGHYTQIVSPISRQVGCARVKCVSEWVFVICDYSALEPTVSGNAEGPSSTRRSQ